jgi:hypothetical protein
MNNKLNYSSLDDAWGKNINSDDISSRHEHNLSKTENNWKNTNNVLSISSNEISELKNEINNLKEIQKNSIEHFDQNTIKPCALVNEHVKKCSICRNNIINELQYINTNANENFSNNIINHNNKRNNSRKNNVEHYNEYQTNIENEDDNDQEYNMIETFENITPSQKNLLLIIIYGILIIVISDLLIKDTKLTK